MKYIPEKMTERMMRVRELYKNTPVALEDDPYKDRYYRCNRSGDRMMTLGFLRGWLKYSKAVTTRLRTSYAEAEELYESKPIIMDDELLLGHLYLPEFTPEEKEEYDRLCDMYVMSSHTLAHRPPRKDHIGLDFDKLLRLGVEGLIAEAEDAKAALDLVDSSAYPDYEAYIKREFYDCCIIELRAVLDLASRYSAEARRMAHAAAGSRRDELLTLADMLERVPAKPAKSFYEAVQSVQFFLSTLFGLFPLGRPDRYLYPYFKTDIESGAITKELAQELIDNFCLHISTRVYSRAACGFIVGGRDANGKNVDNELTYMFITALDHIRMSDPNGALAVNKDTDIELLRYCTEVLSRGVTHPAFYNDDAIIESLINNYGVERADAVQYIHSTCAEITTCGSSKGHSTPFSPDMPKLLVETVKSDPDIGSFDELLEAFVASIKKNAAELLDNYVMRMLDGARNGDDAMRICTLVADCMSRGKSVLEGGEKYMFIQPNMIGFATALDSLVAIRELVYNEKRLTLAEFLKIIEGNFEGHEELRRHIIRDLPHYGNDDERSDELAGVLAKKLRDIFKSPDFPLSKYMVPGTFSYISHATKGACMGATFDGRLSGVAYSDGCCSVQGRDMNGPTSMVKSLTSWDQSEFLGGMVVNVKFGSGMLSGEGADKFIAILRSFIERGGIELQVNCVDRQTLLDAMENPDAHSDLLVRVGGYSDYFVRLKPELKAEVIERTQY